MADEGLSDASSRKPHPFFVKVPAFSSSDSATLSVTPANDKNEAKRVRTNNYAPLQPDYMDAALTYCGQPCQENGIGSQQPQPQLPYQQPSLTNFADEPQLGIVPVSNYPISQPSVLVVSGEQQAMFFSETSPFVAHIQPGPQAVCADTSASRSVAPQAPMPHDNIAQIHEPQPSASRPHALAAVPHYNVASKKVLRLNTKTGTLGSPPKPKPTERSSRIVTIEYGRNSEDRKRISDKVSQILAGQLRIEEPAPKAKKTTQNKPQHDTPKTTHPFFAKEELSRPAATSDKKRSTVFMSTPVSPRRPRNNFAPGKQPAFGNISTGTRVPGAKHPLWPPHSFSHIRGEQPAWPSVTVPINRLKKKSKGQTVSINSRESVLGLLGQQLDIQSVKRSLPRNDDLFPPPPTELRLPTRHFESGCKLAHRIRSQIQSDVASLTSGRDVDEDDLAREPPKPVHPVIDRHWQSLAQQLSAFDRSTCESISWVSKYAPTSSSEVLQPGREVALLKQWLEMLRVQGVESAGGAFAKSKSDIRRKKRKSKLDGFIVDSEDESGEMNELSDLEDQPPGAKRRSRPSVARSLNLAGKDPSKLANTILVSGPHGSGKSASVYAVAKELGFEVFEINSSTRRSGKDILERIGDMTRNHLVQHHQSESSDATEATESETNSGKQGMIASFFKPKTGTEKIKKTGKTRTRVNTGGRSSSSKSQKQSLILLEEVDILFEEDKQFWASLQSLVSQSKRPFVLTCSDESAVPMNTLDLHGIFRFLPAPESLAVDTCLLIAANEGHALKRNAVQALYRCRDYDLRATITDLQFWCQIGVGDHRGGHDWFYLRWPRGIDVDKKGQPVRVISEDTYETGMGWLSRDRIIAAPDTQTMEQEAAEQVWHFWHEDLADWHVSKDLRTLAAVAPAGIPNRQQRIQVLTAHTEYYDNLSWADICAAGVFGVELDEVLDPTPPEMPETARQDFTVAQALLEADVFQPHFCSRVGISSSISALALDNLKTSATASSAALIRENDAYGEQKTTGILEDAFVWDSRKLTRYDVAVAFDPIAVSPKAISSMTLDPSVFDRTMAIIVMEVAPWVRGIVHHDDRLMQDRQRLNELLGDSGRRKRMRTTRSAYSALEGGERRTTRKERYFGDCLSTEAVMHTAGEDWQQTLPLREKFLESEDDNDSSPTSMQ